MRFKTFLEGKDIFGFDAARTPPETGSGDMLERPLKMFNIELMMDILSRKSVCNNQPYTNFITEMVWGHDHGSIKLDVGPGYAFWIKKLGYDKQGNPTWATKTAFQLNRQGYGGTEDSVAQEIHECIEKASRDGPVNVTEFTKRDLENLVVHITNKIKRTARNIFIYEGIRRVDDTNYLIKMGLRGHGVEAPGHHRIEENLTQVHYDEETGIIHITNYNVASSTGGTHNWEIHPKDLDLYFFPSQDREEISECIAVRMKYY